MPARTRDTASSENGPVDALPALRLAPALTPHGRLHLVSADDAPALEPTLARRLTDAFAAGSGHGLLQLGGAEVATPLPAALGYWRELGARYVTAVATRPSADGAPEPLPTPDRHELETLALGAPPMPGAEYVTADVLAALWREIDAAFADRLRDTGLTVEALLRTLNPAWNVVGRVHFNLALNPRDEDAPFAFLATYTHQLSARGRAQHLPLGEALREYAGARHRERLLALLLPVQRAAEQRDWLRAMVDAGELFHPLRWTAGEAYRLLSDVPALEQAGIVVRMPAAWGRRPPRPQATATVGARPPAGLGADALLDFRLDVTIDGERVTPAELRALLAGTRGLALLRGRWVEVDPEHLRATLDRLRETERLAAEGGLTFAEAARLLAGADVTGAADAPAADPAWTRVAAGPWLEQVLRELRAPDASTLAQPGAELRGTLRPYQAAGVRWLHLLATLGLGACLADDMGLGKTIQVLALLLVRRRERGRKRAAPSLLVVPASLLANWQEEIARFAPTLRAIVAHPSAMPRDELRGLDAARVAGVDLVLTTYATVQRLTALGAVGWDLVILDEAQAIKNPGAKQTRAAKALAGRARIALTGTPVENRLGDLWSLFDFLNPGLLGSAKQFAGYTQRLARRPHNPYGPLRELLRPYILRRLKTDRAVVADLPEKTEVTAYCHLSRAQAALYAEAVDALRAAMSDAEGIRRRGVVLASLLRLKQICNHPSQWLGDDAWAERDSGKLIRLRELAETIGSRQEKALVFTQFREATAPLATFLGAVFGRPGLVLHGGTSVAQRGTLVRRFQDDETVPFFVISLKAGGTGLNLTAASHVIHFDRWWNPAVENQATDRAFRIGQRRNVLVHKFVCRGTVEEKIDALVASKARLSAELLAEGGELDLTALADDELLRLVSLDLGAAMQRDGGEA